ncbi:hypothetical protein [Thermus caldifontis]|uniref:hypothetical protein n=1 Tax=Thermus caldifontis TaxID=1930763 RepID=UPI000DF4C6A4|nr:hypothetical protein [Thermus caldifontis]
MRRWIDRGPKWVKRDPVPYIPYQGGPEEYKGAPVATQRWIDRGPKWIDQEAYESSTRVQNG